MNKKILAGLIAIPLLASIVVAIYISGMRIGGLFTATGGKQPEEILFTEDIQIWDDSEIIFNKTYTNADDLHNLTFYLDDSRISSVSFNCTYQTDKDFQLLVNNQNIQTNPVIPVTNGDNKIQFRVIPSPYRCGLNGSYNITGVLS